MLEISNYINGDFVESTSKLQLDVIDPSSAKVYGKMPSSNKDDIELAVQAAEKALPNWKNSTLAFRSKILQNIADLIENNAEDLARAESKDNGKPISLAAKVDIPRAAQNFSFFAKAITQFSSEAHESSGLQSINFTLRKPIGIVGCISPWNLPLYLFTWKIAPALAAGNCVVAKPSEVTPVTAFMLSKICIEAGLPKGVLNIVHGLGPAVGNALVKHPKIKAISFTGGTATGKHIATEAAPQFKKLSLELGGKNPNLIFADCDYSKMLATTVKSSFANQGQICLCGSRIFVEKSIYEQFKKDFINEVKKLKVGHPAEKSTNLGALVSKAHLEKVESYVQQIKHQNAKLLHGGNRVKVKDYEDGFYFEPTVIEVQSNTCALNQEEIFGPVVTIMPFKDETEALHLANESPYGLSATLWTQNIDRAMRLSQELETGIVWVNTWLNRDLRTPFGGTKQSGVGREGGLEALRFFTEPKNICIAYNQHP
ncbi:aldehyde dehydrogenase [Psychroflexus planctonicus]|uniref:2-hydroxymuconic semialdehyde dehydrogenase n=1 Tax=Psychroflexus planctonicus TaxID=1526575 RepID=A0ABQ1SJU5_9FLAO|nr:aldehyde dehydrogenase [Psychroflexus planctonicus]GGE43572.1 2-hydroxymuconic semialdehyde dehydrogenase [Psychroflexus planctonicus]